MSKRALVVVVVLGLGLGACTTALPPERTTAIGPPFNEEVKAAYVRLASAELSDGRYATWHHFHSKARAAMWGDDVFPDRVASRELAPEHRAEALELRQRLVAALEGGARERAPAHAANAQVSFDCWLRELEARPGGRDAVACREALLAALEQSEVAAIEVPESYRVAFDPGRTTLDARDLAVIDEAARAANLVRASRIEVVGFADRSGAPAYNQQLSERRAEAVATALLQAGAPAAAIRARGEGGVGDPRDPQSRRVEIRITR
jgi:OmpA-OmpF porin, OOP family